MLPLLSKPKVYILLTILLVNFPSIAQITVKTIPPEFIEPCGPNYTYKITIEREISNPFSGGIMTYSLPSGLNYITGSVSNSTTRETDLTNLQSPVFQIPPFSSRSYEFNIKAKATCTTIVNTEVLRDSIRISVGNETYVFEGTKYNKNVPVLKIIDTEGLEQVANESEFFTQTFTILNAGFSSVSAIQVTDNIDQNSIELISFSHGKLIDENPILIEISDEDFTSIGNENEHFDPQEEFKLTLKFKVKDCVSSGASRIEFGWGCKGETCRIFEEFQSNIIQDRNTPYLIYTVLDQQFAGFCSDGVLTVQIINRASETTPGAATAFDLILGPSMDILSFGNDFSGCFQLSDFQIGNQSINTSYDKVLEAGIDLGQIDSDPDGPGGLSDLDGDGAFDDLGADDTTTMSFYIQFDKECLELDCTQDFPNHSFRLIAEYNDQCNVNPVARTIHGPSHTYSLRFSSTVSDLLLTSEKNDSFFVGIQFNGQVRGFSQNCNDDLMIIRMELPSVLDIPANFQPTFRNDPIPFSIEGNLLSLFPKAFSGKLELLFAATCDSIPAKEEDLPCGGIVDLPSDVHKINYQVEYHCASESCNSELILHCDQSPEFLLRCPVSTSNIGIVEQEFITERVSLGWKDSLLTSKVSHETPGLRLQTAMTFDTLLFELSGIVKGPDNFDSTKVRIAYRLDEGENPLEFLYDTLQFYDFEEKQWFSCHNIQPDTSIVNQELRFEFSILDLLENGQCLENIHLTDGDTIRFKSYFIVTDEAPQEPSNIPGLLSKFVFNYQGKTYKCGGHFRNFKIFSPYFNHTWNYEYSGNGCDTIELSFSMLQGKRNTGNFDYFPNEYRPLVYWDSIKLNFPNWVKYLPNTASISYESREGNTESGPILYSVQTLNNPIIQQFEDSWSIILPRDTTLPIVDYIKEETEAAINLKILPECLSRGELRFEEEIYFTKNFYATDQREPVSETRRRNIPYGVYSRSFKPVQQTFVGLSDTAFWSFQLCQSYSRSDFSPNNWIYFEIPSADVKLLEIREIIDEDDFVVYPLIRLDDGNYWVKIDTLYEGQCRLFELRGDFTACTETYLNLYSNFDCNGYPSDPASFNSACYANPDRTTLYLDPQNADLQINLVTTPDSPVNLCESLLYEFKVINAGIGGAFQMAISVDLPANGTSYAFGSSQVKFGENNAYQKIQDPVVDIESGRLVWKLVDFEGLLGLNQYPQNELRLKFQLNTDCNYIDQSSFSYHVSWVDACKEAHQTTNFFSLPVQLQGAPQQFNQYRLNIYPREWYICGQGNPVTISITNLGGSIDDLTGDEEKIRLSIPKQLTLQSGGVRNIHNGPPNPMPEVTVRDSLRILVWEMSPGISKNDSIVFQLNLIGDNLNCSDLPVNLDIFTLTGIPCRTARNGFCDIQFFSTSTDLLLEARKPNLQLKFSEVYASVLDQTHEMYYFETILENRSEFSSIGNLVIDFFFDSNDNTVFEEGIDRQVSSKELSFHFNNMQNEVSFENKFPVPVDSTCKGIFVILSFEDNECLCSTQHHFFKLIPLRNTGSSKILCLGDSITVGQAPQMGYRYEWTPSSSLDNQFSAESTYAFSGTLNSDYLHKETLILTTTRSGGCQTRDSIEITTTTVEVDLEVSQPISCNGFSDGTVTADIRGGLAPLEWEWQNGEKNARTLTNIGTGDYSITLTNNQGCIASDSIQLIEPAPLVLELEKKDLQCHQGYDGEIKAIVEGGTPTYEYDWSNGENIAEINQLAAGTYHLTVTDFHGCKIKAQDSLTEPPPMFLDIKVSEVLCPGDENGAIEIEGVQSDSLRFSLTGGNYQYETVFDSLGSGAYTLHVVDSLFCYNTFKVILYPPPTPLVQLPEYITIDPGESIALNPTIHESVEEIKWDPDSTLSCINCIQPVAFPLAGTKYTVRVKNGNGCEEKDEVIVRVRTVGKVYAPNVFSPNGDGINDRFTLYTNEIDAEILEFSVFDRWGQHLYEQHHFPPNETSYGWDGTLNGVQMNTGVYIYWARIKFQNGEVLLKKGDILLIK